MLSALIRLTTSPSNDSDTYKRLSELLFNGGHHESVSSQPVLSLVDEEFDVCLKASFDANGIVTDINLKK